MKNIYATIIFSLTFAFHSYGQEAKIVYIVDSIPVIEDPEYGNEILQDEVADLTVIKNKDTLKRLGYDGFDAAAYLFTKAYRSRPEDIKKIPSLRQMKQIGGVWHFRGGPYTGPFIDYYYSGRKRGEGTLKNGKAEGPRKMYFQNGNVSMERLYSQGLENGLEKEYYENGALKQKGAFVNGKEEGIWEMYFPNGQVKQRSTLKNGMIEGESTIFYSNGKILAVELTRNGKTIPDKRLKKVNDAQRKGHEKNRQGDFSAAIKHYTKAIEADSTSAESYFARGTSRLNNLQFDEALVDFDKALELEPYLYMALANRAFARIRKHQFAGSRQLGGAHGVQVLATKADTSIPESDRTLICSDLRQAYFLGDEHEKVIKALEEFCR